VRWSSGEMVVRSRHSTSYSLGGSRDYSTLGTLPAASNTWRQPHPINNLTGIFWLGEQKFINFIPAQHTLGQASGYTHLHDFLNVMSDGLNVMSDSCVW